MPLYIKKSSILFLSLSVACCRSDPSAFSLRRKLDHPATTTTDIRDESSLGDTATVAPPGSTECTDPSKFLSYGEDCDNETNMLGGRCCPGGRSYCWDKDPVLGNHYDPIERCWPDPIPNFPSPRGGPCRPGLGPTDCGEDLEVACGQREYAGRGEEGEYICCPTGESSAYYYGVCKDLPLGAQCFFETSLLGDNNCESGVCINNVCVAEQSDAGEPCDSAYDHSDCKSGSCGRVSFPDGPFVCCEDSIYPKLSENDFVQENQPYYCWQPDGAVCGGLRDICRGDCSVRGRSEIGVCVCTNRSCGSGACVDGVCLHDKVENGGVCDSFDDDDCQSGACAVDSRVTDTVNHICCPSGQKKNAFLDLFGRRGYHTICLQLPGEPCLTGDDDECVTSSICIGNVCRDERQAEGESCDIKYSVSRAEWGDNRDCSNNKCGRSSYPDGPFICCPGGRKAYGSINKGDGTYAHYCLQPEGAACNGRMCESGLSCVDGGCVENY